MSISVRKRCYGMPVLLECRDIYDCAARAAERGLSFVEMNASFPPYHPSALPPLDQVGEKYGVFFTMHADEGLDPFHLDDRISRAWFDVMREEIACALRYGMPVLNMHLQRGVYVTLPDRVVLLTDVYRERYLARVRDFIAMCEAEIGGADLRIAVENVDSHAFTAAEREALSLMLQSRAFALTLDTGHEHCLHFADREVYETYADRLLHMHLHDSNGRQAHLPLGSAAVDVQEALSRLRGPTCLLEVKTLEALDESLIYLRRMGMLPEA